MDEAGAAPRRRIDLRWTKRRKQRFLERLAETYDMDAACAAAGLDWPTMCRLRGDDAEFAARWEAVIASGYDRIEAMLLRRAGAGLGDGARADEADVALARELLRQRGGRKTGDPAAPRRTVARPSPNREQAIASIMGKLTAFPGRAPRPKDDEDEGAPLAGMAQRDRGLPAG